MPGEARTTCEPSATTASPPPRVAGRSAFVYDPATFHFTTADAGTAKFVNLRNLRNPQGCSEVDITATTADGKPIRFRFTLHTDQMNK